MRKVRIIKVLAFALVLVAVDQIGGRVLDRWRDGIFAAHPSVDKVYYVANHIDEEVVIIGASAATGGLDSRQMADSLGMSVFNAAISGSGPKLQCCLIRLMLEHHKPRCILWEIGEHDFSDIFANIDYNNAVDIYPYYDNKEYVRGYIDAKDRWQSLRMFSRLYRHNGKLAHYISVMRGPVQDSLLGFEPLPATGYQYPVLTEDVGTADEYNASFSQARYDTVRNAIRYCQEQGVEVIITTAPRFTIADLENTVPFRKLVELSQECGCEHINLIRTDTFLNDGTLFHDMGHLNCRGAELYTEMVIQKLKK